MPTDPTLPSRDQELRRMLVATSSAAIARPRRRGTVFASIAAFVVAGALTGGAVSALALGGDDQPATVSIKDMKELVVHDDAQLYGTPFTLSAQGDTAIQLGTAPEGAEQVALAFHCTDAGTFVVLVDGEQQGDTTCSADDAASGYGGSGGYHSIIGDGEHTLTIRTARSNHYVLWTSWATRAPTPEASAAQNAALADGVVTEAEYREGFARYDTCMTNAGFPLVGVDESGTIITYSNSSDAVTSGIETGCYAMEFNGLDGAWQIENEDTSYTAKVMAACLTAHGIAPEPTVQGMHRQLGTIPLTEEQCLTGQ